jgi:hypothetical protein
LMRSAYKAWRSRCRWLCRWPCRCRSGHRTRCESHRRWLPLRSWFPGVHAAWWLGMGSRGKCMRMRRGWLYRCWSECNRSMSCWCRWQEERMSGGGHRSMKGRPSRLG